MGKGSQTAQGAAGGAAMGTAILPGWGTLIGGIAGGAAGYFSDDPKSSYEERLKKLSAGYGNRTAPQMGPAATGQYSGFRQNQAGLIAQLEAMARGEGPSAATMQMREAMARAGAAQSAGAAGAGGRGVNSGAAFRTAANNTAAIQSQGARDTGLMRVGEQMGAIGQLGQAVGQGRAADENMNQFNAGQSNQVGIANLEAKLKSLGLNDTASLQALLAALSAAGPGMGTQVMAGAATATPAILAYKQAQANKEAQAKPAQAPTPKEYG